MLKPENNKIEIIRHQQFSEIHIQVKKSCFSGEIYFNFFVLAFFWFFAFSAIRSVLFGSDSDSAGFLILWLFAVCTISYLTFETSLWLKKGAEKIHIDQEKVIVTKYIPLFLLTRNHEEVETISFENLDKIYFSEYIVVKSQLPRPSKGNIHLKNKTKKISFGINLTKQEADLILKEINAFKNKNASNVDNIATNV